MASSVTRTLFKEVDNILKWKCWLGLIKGRLLVYICKYEGCFYKQLQTLAGKHKVMLGRSEQRSWCHVYEPRRGTARHVALLM